MFICLATSFNSSLISMESRHMIAPLYCKFPIYLTLSFNFSGTNPIPTKLSALNAHRIARNNNSFNCSYLIRLMPREPKT